MENSPEGHVIQIRYADTPEQKALKQQTTAARQYRTAEYESQTGQSPQTVASHPFSPARINAFTPNGGAFPSDFGQYMNNANGYVYLF